MHPAILKKAVSVVVCLAFLMLIVPGAINAEKKVAKSSSRPLLTKPLLLVYSLFPYLAGLLKLGLPGLPSKDMPQKANYKPTLNARPTGDLPPPCPSDGD